MNNDFDFIDNLARDALKNFEVEFNPEDWAEMEEKLDKGDHLFPRLWLFKGIEVSVMLLAIFTVFNFVMPTTTSTQHHPKAGSNTIGIDAINIPADNNRATENTANWQDLVPTATEHSNNASSALPQANADSYNQGNTNNQTNKKESFIADNSTLSNAVNSSNQTNRSIVASSHNANRNNQANTDDQNLANQLALNSNSGDNGATNNNTANSNNSADESAANLANTNATEANTETAGQLETDVDATNKADVAPQAERKMLSTEMIQGIKLDNGNKEGDPLFEIKRAKPLLPHHRHLRLGIVFAPEANIGSGYGSPKIGYSGGLLMEAELTDRFSLESGLVVSQKSFSESRNFAVSSLDDEGKEIRHLVDESRNARMTILQVPIQAQVMILDLKKWKFSVNFGGAANLIAGKNFVGDQVTNTQQEDGALTLTTSINPNSYERGLFQGGNITENAYLTVGGGVTLERQLGDKLGLFIRPDYQHSVTRFGATKSKLGTFSLYIGLKTTF